MIAEVKRDVKWLLVTSLIMFFWTAWSTLITTPYLPPMGGWFYLKNITVLSFIITISLATIYTTNFWKEETIFKATIVMYIISASLFFATNMQWTSHLLGIWPY